ncbi:MAG: hypothetical protein HYW05_05530 [Candidatus Diapherotrites archaeon]|nr:hypothetical protein [Candidatus Diapherotrites archaeon]
MARIELIGGIILCFAAVLLFVNFLLTIAYIWQNVAYIAFMALMVIGLLMIMVALIGRLSEENKGHAPKSKKRR